LGGGGGGAGGHASYSTVANQGPYTGNTIVIGGAGGFGGGGGGAPFGRGNQSGGGGFFGGGAGGDSGGYFGGWGGLAGFAAGTFSGTSHYGGLGSYTGGGGGGAGAGGAVFVEGGATLVVQGSGTVSGGSVVGGAGGVSPSGSPGEAGSALGNGIYVGSAFLTLAPGNGNTLTVADAIDGGKFGGNLAIGSGTVLLNASNTFGNSGGNAEDSPSIVVGTGGTLQLNAANAFFSNVGLNGGVTLDAGATVDVAVNGADGSGITFAGPGATLRLAQGVTETTSLTGFGSLDAIDLAGVTNGAGPATAHFTALNDQLTIGGTNGGTLTFQLPLGVYDAAGFVASLDAGGTGTTVTYAPCFAAGTRIATPSGTIAVEELREGQLVLTLSGRAAPVVWLGHRRVDCRRHPRPHDVWPVRVRAGAFAPGRPARDVVLSPDHAVFVDAVLIPVRYLINGATVVQEPVAEITYHHVELPAHEVLLAEGLPVESYLDTGNRAAFENGAAPGNGTEPGDGEGAAPIMLHPDFARRIWASAACAPLVLDGPRLRAARQTLLDRARQSGHAMTADPDLRIRAGGHALATDVVGQSWRLLVPPGARRIRLQSRRWVPAHVRPAEHDTRALGVAISRIWLDRREASLESPALGSGWHAPEPGWRWTNGDAELALTEVRELAFEVAMTGTYWRVGNGVGSRLFGAAAPSPTRQQGC